MGLGRQNILALTLVAITGLAPTTALVAQSSRDLYKDALKAVEVQEWQTAIGLLRKAIEDDPSAKAGAFKRYVPHYYLGLSLFELGNCRAALTVWKESEGQEVITRLKEYGTLQQGQVICLKRITRMEATNDLTEISALATTLGDVRSQPEVADYWQKGDPSWNDRYAAAEDLMAAVRSVLEQGDSQVSLAQLEEARDQVAAASAQLEAIQGEARTAFKNVQAKRDVRSRLISMVVEEARTHLDSTAYLAPFPDRIGQLRANVEQLVASTEVSAKNVDPDQLDDLRLELSKAVERLKQASIPPPSVLLDATDAYFAADYEGVLAILDRQEFKSGRSAAHAHLFRAASLFTLWIASGQEDEMLGVAARGAVRSCRQEDIGLVPVDSAFSPSFVDFFFSEGQVRAPIPLD